MSTSKFKDEDMVILLYKMDTRIFKEKNTFGKLKAKIKRLNDQKVDLMVLPAAKEVAIDLFLDNCGAKKEKLH